MSNPSPRPALRKADDAAVHPAAPQPARPARTTGPTATPPTPKAEAAPRRSARAKATVPMDVIPATARPFSGATSDTMRTPELDALEHVVPIGAARPVEAKKTKKDKKAHAEAREALMKGKSTDLDVRVPKALAKAARARAKAEGLDLDTVVIDLLHEWTTRGL